MPLSGQQFVDCDTADSACNGEASWTTAWLVANKNASDAESSNSYPGTMGTSSSSSCTHADMYVEEGHDVEHITLFSRTHTTTRFTGGTFVTRCGWYPPSQRRNVSSGEARDGN